MTIYVKGRFLTQPVSGVQRHAREILDALDRAPSGSADLRDQLGTIEGLVPKRVDTPGW